MGECGRNGLMELLERAHQHGLIDTHWPIASSRSASILHYWDNESAD